MQGLVILAVTILIAIAAISGMSVVIGVPLSYVYDAIASWVYPTMLQREFTTDLHMPWYIGSCIVFVFMIIGWALKSNVTVKKD